MRCVLPRPSALQSIGVRNDFVRVAAERPQALRIKIGRAEALVHKKSPLRRVAQPLKAGRLGVDAIEKCRIVRIDNENLH